MSEKKENTGNITLDNSVFIQVLKSGYSMDMYFLLKNPILFMEPIKRIESLKKQALRKGLITSDVPPNLTKAGRDFVNLSKFEDYYSPSSEETVAKFEKWWEEYPPTDGFSINGVVFERTRSLRKNKSECYNIFARILDSKEVELEEMINALKEEVAAKKIKSLKENKNNLTFMVNSLTYLKNRAYESWINKPKNERQHEYY